MIKASAKSIAGLTVSLVLLLPVLASASGGGGEEYHFPWKDIGWAAANFTLLMILAVVLLRKPLKKALVGWRESLQKDLREAEELKNKAQAKLDEIKAKLANIESERRGLLEEFRQAGELEKDRIIKEAKAEADRITKDAEQSIVAELERAKMMLERQVIEQAITFALASAEKQMNRPVQDALVESYIAELNKPEADR